MSIESRRRINDGPREKLVLLLDLGAWEPAEITDLGHHRVLIEISGTIERDLLRRDFGILSRELAKNKEE